MRKHTKKTLTYILLSLVILAGVYYVVHENFVGQAKRDAEALKQEIAALEGANIEDRLIKVAAPNTLVTGFPDGADAIFSFAGLSTKTEEGRGVVVINEPKISIVAENSPVIELALPKLEVSRVDGNHYVFKPIGDIDFYYDTQKKYSIQHDQITSEMKFGAAGLELQKLDAKNLKLVEANGGTTLFSIAAINSETHQGLVDNLLNLKSKTHYSQINPGDMIKLFIGKIDPADIVMDYEYKGENILASTEEVKGFAGNLKVNAFNVKFGDAGLEANADLNFKKENIENLPIGDAYIKFVNYNKIMVFLVKYFPMLPRDGKMLSMFLMEVGADEGQDASFDIKMNGTKKYLINGKSEDEFKKLYEKHFPPGITAGKMMGEPEKAEASPIEPTPIVEKKSLPTIKAGKKDGK